MTEKKTSPWLSGIIDTLCGAEIIRKSSIGNRNRLAVILIDSAFEIACRAYLRHKAKITLSEAHKRRDNLVKTVQSKLRTIDKEVWDNIDFYYSEIRCDLYHESAAKTVTDVSLLEYRDTVEFVIDQAFDTQVRRLIESQLVQVEEASQVPGEQQLEIGVPVAKLEAKIDKIIVGVASVEPRNAKELNDFFKKEGSGLRLKKNEFTQILARNQGTRKYFYYDRELKRWKLSSLGRFKLGQLASGD